MKATELYSHINKMFGSDLKRKDIDKGQSYFWKEHRVGPASTRVLRIHEDSTGSIGQVKLPVRSIRDKAEVFLPLPASLDDVIAAIRQEIALLEQ
jgi:hypothetical protein